MGVGKKTCPVTIITWMSVTIARPNTIAGLRKRKPSQLHFFADGVWGNHTVLKEKLVDLILGRNRL
jgi:hypothetical protein